VLTKLSEGLKVDCRVDLHMTSNPTPLNWHWREVLPLPQSPNQKVREPRDAEFQNTAPEPGGLGTSCMLLQLLLRTHESWWLYNFGYRKVQHLQDLVYQQQYLELQKSGLCHISLNNHSWSCSVNSLCSFLKLSASEQSLLTALTWREWHIYD
jgi:hypothetical protein